MNLTLPNSCTVAYELLFYMVSVNLRGRKDDFFFSRTLLNSGDRLTQEDESPASTAAKGEQSETPRQCRAHQSSGKRKGNCQRCSAMQDMEFSCDKHPLSTDFLRHHMDNAFISIHKFSGDRFNHSNTLNHWYLFFNLHITSLAGIFLGVPYRKLSYSEDKISCVLGKEICLYLIKKKKKTTIYMTAKEPNQNHLSGAKRGTHVLMFSNKNYQVSFYISYCH